MAALKADRYVVPAAVGGGLTYHIGMSAGAKAALTRVADRLGMKETAAAGRAFAWLAGQDAAMARSIATGVEDEALVTRLALERIGSAPQKPARPRAAVGKLAEQLGVREFVLVSRFFTWLSRQEDMLAKGVLGLLPAGYEGLLASVAIDRREKAAPKSRRK